MKKEIEDFKGRLTDLEDVYKIDYFKPDKEKPGKFFIELVLKENKIIVYQSIGTADTWYYNDLELSYVLDTLGEYVKGEYKTDTKLKILDIVEFCRKQLYQANIDKINELSTLIKALEKKIQDVTEQITIKDVNDK